MNAAELREFNGLVARIVDRRLTKGKDRLAITDRVLGEVQSPSIFSALNRLRCLDEADAISLLPDPGHG